MDILSAMHHFYTVIESYRDEHWNSNCLNCDDWLPFMTHCLLLWLATAITWYRVLIGTMWSLVTNHRSHTVVNNSGLHSWLLLTRWHVSTNRSHGIWANHSSPILSTLICCVQWRLWGKQCAWAGQCTSMSWCLLKPLISSKITVGQTASG